MYKLAKLAGNKILMLLAIFGVGLMVAVPVMAQEEDCDPSEDPFCLEPIENSTVLGNRSIQATVSSIINVALSLLGIVAVVIVLIGGFKWMTAGGADDKTAEARKFILSGVIGLAIILSAWALTRFVMSNLETATQVQRDNF